MSWRNRLPTSSEYDTLEEYEEAVDSYLDALEADYEERRINEM